MTNENEGSLFKAGENAYQEQRLIFEGERSSNAGRVLYDRVRQIVDGDTVETRDKSAILDPDTTTATGVDLLRPGEHAVSRITHWSPYGKRRMASGSMVDLSIRFKAVDFLDENQDSRPGSVGIEGRLEDEDEVSAEFPIAGILQNEERGSFQLTYPFGTEIEYGSNDYSEVAKMIRAGESPDQVIKREHEWEAELESLRKDIDSVEKALNSNNRAALEGFRSLKTIVENQFFPRRDTGDLSQFSAKLLQYLRKSVEAYEDFPERPVTHNYRRGKGYFSYKRVALTLSPREIRVLIRRMGLNGEKIPGTVLKQMEGITTIGETFGTACKRVGLT